MAKTSAPISWRRNLAAIWVTELVAIAAFAVAIPFLPFFVQELGVQGERAIRLWSGLVFSTHAIAMAICGPIWGALSDRHGRKVMVERAMFGGAVVIGLIGWAQNMGQFMVLRALWGALTGTITAATTLVAATTPRKHAGYALGMLQMAIYLGSSTGPLLGGIVADAFGYRATFWVTGALLFVAGLGVSIFVREDFEPVVRPAEEERAGDGTHMPFHHRVQRQLAPVLGSSALLAMLGVHLLARTGTHMMTPVLPLFIQEIVPAGARVAFITGLVSSVSGALGAAGALGFGRLGDRVGHRWILIGCASAAAVLYVPQFFASSPAALLFLQGGTGLAMGGILASVSASLARLSPEGQEGIVYGVQGTVLSIAHGGGPMLGSVLMAWVGLRMPFLAAAALFAAAAIAAFRLLPKGSSTEGRADQATPLT
jgi:DHA1 family multidrug resistance protein-like MFS transporter